MELNQLHYFLKVAEHLNFSRAAEALYISQPSLSYQIAALERELSTALFIRDRRKISLSPAGMALVEPAKAILAQAEQLNDIVRKESGKDTGLLCIGFDDTEDHFELVGVTETIARFAKENPGVELSMLRTPFTECVDQLTYGDLDVAFLITRHRERLSPDLAGRQVFESRLLMVISEESSAQNCAEAISSMDLLLVREKPRGNSHILKALENMKLEPRIRRVDSIVTGFVYAQMGKGIMIMSETYFNNHQYTGLRAIQIPDEAAVLTHEVVWNRGIVNPMVPRLLEYFPEL